jgi:lipoprotein-anchoring transpeptidase ErfK/SrfK
MKVFDVRRERRVKDMKRHLLPRLILSLVAFVLCLSAFAPARPALATPLNSGGFWYTVKAGDTVSGISARFDVSVAGIMRANNLTSARNIYAGQRLYLPPEADSPGRSSSATANNSSNNASKNTGAATAVPATPTAPVSGPGKVIYISLGKQHMWAYQDGKQVFSFIASSGIPTRATKPGTFRVQSKIPEAWSNIWQLRMPYWLGIYNVGRVENGIHALPINTRGIKLWAGLLGRPASFGCIILNDKNAAALYNWADVGTLVVIRY